MFCTLCNFDYQEYALRGNYLVVDQAFYRNLVESSLSVLIFIHLYLPKIIQFIYHYIRQCDQQGKFHPIKDGNFNF